MKIELCAASIEAVHLAVKYKFDRVELCQALEVGGLSPSMALQKKAFDLFPNTHVLIRPRIGNFVYSDNEKQLILNDIQESVNAGAKGIVVGALKLDHTLDYEFIKEIRVNFPNVELTFHRAFDDIKNPIASLEQLIELKVNRILTAGGNASVLEGVEQIKSCIKNAKGRIEIMMGGGITENNIKTILKEVQADAIHFSGTILHKSTLNSLFDEKLLLVSEIKVAEILKEIALI